MSNYNEEENDILDRKEESEEQDFSDKKIFQQQSDTQIKTLFDEYKRGRLKFPDYQRGFVCDKKKSCQLIESILIGIPIPAIYLSEQDDGTLNVIDGQQRLTALFSYIDGKIPPDNDVFKLTGLLKKKELNNKKYEQLELQVQERIERYPLRVIIFQKESDKDLQFEIFARLNRGSVSLNEQELRNCVYRGRFNDLIKELSQNKDFQYLLGLSKPHKRMADRELVLRFAAFYFKDYLNYTPPIKKFLNDTMLEYKNITDQEFKKLENVFKISVSNIKSLFDNKAFKRFNVGNAKKKNGAWGESVKINVSLFDVLMYSFAKLDKNSVMQNLDAIREAFIDLMTNDEEFIESIEISTSDKTAVRTRFDKWRSRLEKIVEIGKKEPRCFSYKLKEELYEKENICAICNNKIQNIDDAAIDHIEQYWLGGKTIPKNARLTHRYCNNARARKEK